MKFHTWLLPRVPQCRGAVTIKHKPREGTAHGGSARDGREGNARERKSREDEGNARQGTARLGVITQLPVSPSSSVLPGALGSSQPPKETTLRHAAATTSYLADRRSSYPMAP